VSYVTDLARPEIVALRPYQPAAALDGIRLNANEAPWRQDWDTTERGLNRYPEPCPPELVGVLARMYRVEPAQIAVTRGSDDAIDLLVRVFCRAGRDGIVVCPPTFGMYEVAAQIQGATVHSVPLDAERGFSLDSAAVLARSRANVKLVFLCSPNNPTGNSVPAGEIRDLCAALDGTALVIVDEAYIEFSEQASATQLLDDYQNLVVLRTLSKAHALAGARVGALLAAPAVVDLVRGVMPPYALPSPSIDAACRLSEHDYARRIAARINGIRHERERVAAKLPALPGVIRVWPSDGNFLLAQFTEPARVLEHVASRGILLRDFSTQPGLSGCVRISIGDRGQNDALLAAIAEIGNG
jgi:histidinol-phosphate aminotransferase